MPIYSSLRPQPREIVMTSSPPDIGQPTREARTGREDRGQRGNRWWTLVAVCLGTFMLLLDITIVNVALPDIQRALQSSFADLQWVVDAYALTLAAFLLTAGSLADMYGRRRLYLAGLVVFTAASALCGFATSTLMLQLSRALQGAGGAIIFAVSLAVAAFGLSASIFAMILYLVLSLQDILGYSPLAAGVRLMVLSGGILAASTLAGRLTSHVPARLLIGPGLIIIGVGLLLMRGLDAASAWTHLIPGMIVAGAGAGMVNPPLASTAVGVVPPQRAGMASGISSTFRQVGIATGIALLGTLFSSKVHDEVLAPVAAVPGLSPQGPQIATAVQSGATGHVIGQLPPPPPQAVGVITRTAFTTGLDRILLGRGDHRAGVGRGIPG